METPELFTKIKNLFQSKIEAKIKDDIKDCLKDLYDEEFKLDNDYNDGLVTNEQYLKTYKEILDKRSRLFLDSKNKKG